tara:strand:+ start:360 stop:803 length:444 start_codon:yes stop_codon:yes gene_type:complete
MEKNKSSPNEIINTQDALMIHHKKTAIQTGDKILNENHFLRELSELMENEKFNNFFNRYMNDWIGIKSTVTYMKLYTELKNKYSEINDEELNKNIVVFLLTKIMRNKHLMTSSIKTIDDMFDNNKLDFFDEIEKKIINMKCLKDKNE